MKTTTSFAFNLLLVLPVAALFAIPGEAKQPELTVLDAPAMVAVADIQPKGFGLFLDTGDAALSIELPTSILDF